MGLLSSLPNRSQMPEDVDQRIQGPREGACGPLSRTLGPWRRLWRHHECVESLVDFERMHKVPVFVQGPGFRTGVH